MILVLINNEKVEVFRQNCGHQYQTGIIDRPTVEWNIDPIQIINDNKTGFIIIGEWGSGHIQKHGIFYYDNSKFTRMIPVKNVLYIEKPSEWERPIEEIGE